MRVAASTSYLLTQFFPASEVVQLASDVTTVRMLGSASFKVVIGDCHGPSIFVQVSPASELWKSTGRCCHSFAERSGCDPAAHTSIPCAATARIDTPGAGSTEVNLPSPVRRCSLPADEMVQ